MSRNTLKQDQMYPLARYVEANAESHKGLTHQEVAEKATSDLAFTVTKGNVAMARRVTGVVFRSQAGRPPSRHAKGAQERVYWIAKDLVSLMSALGVPASPQTIAIATKRAITGPNAMDESVTTADDGEALETTRREAADALARYQKDPSPANLHSYKRVDARIQFLKAARRP